MEPSSEISRPKSSILNTQIVNQLVDSDLERYSFLKSRNDNDEDIIAIRKELSKTYQDLAQFIVAPNAEKGRFGFLFLKSKDKKSTENNDRLVNFANHWKIFANNEGVREAFGEDKLNIAEERLSRSILEVALSSDRQRQREAMGVLDELDNSSVAPFVILNKFNPFNHYGSKDFGFKEIQEYLSGFSQHRTKELKDSNVAGLREIVDICSNISQASVEDLSRFKSEVARVGIHFLKFGTLQEKLYIAREASGKILSQETRAQIQEVLETSDTPMSVKIEFFTSKLSIDRATDNIFVLNMLLDYLARHKNPQLLSLLKFNEGRIIDSFIEKKELSTADISVLSRVFGESEERMRSAMDFARKQKELNPEFHLLHHERSTEGTLSRLAKFSTNKDIPSLLAKLTEYGYSLTTYQSGMDLDLFDKLLKKKETLLPFIQQLHEKGGYLFHDIGDIDALEKLMLDKDQLISSLSDIRRYLPDFRYFIYYHNRDFVNPYRQFISRIDTNSGFSYKELIEIYRDKGRIPVEFSDPLFDLLRYKLLYSKDASLRDKYHDLEKTKIPPETKIAFGRAINSVLEHVQRHPDIEWFYQDSMFLGVLTIRPEEAEAMASLPDRYPELVSLMQEGGPLYTNRDNIINSIFSGKDFDVQAQEVVSIFTKKQPFWEMLYFYTEKRLRSQLINADTSYPVIDSSSGKRRPFKSLTDQEKLRTFKEYLKTIIESSRSETSKKEADQKNRKLADEKLSLIEGDFIHGTAIDYLPQILLNGNLCGEALGPQASTDSRPFNVDIGRIFSPGSRETSTIIEKSISTGYGKDGKHGQDGQMFLIMKRSSSDYERGVDYQVGPDYALMFVGIPSTAIDAIVLRNPIIGLEPLTHEIVENGFYLPIYDLKGNLVFTSQEYDALRERGNISRAPVEIWDYSLKTGGQKGSNPGAEFIIPEEDGQTKYYVKFKTLENEDSVWNEYLADSIYRTLGISVPETKVVKVNGVYGHASRLIPNYVDGTSQSQDWKKGYLVDCLLANWDIISALEQNTVSVPQSGEVFRVDTGGALLYRARGERKNENDFGAIVNELSEASIVSPKRMGISDESLRTQSQLLKEKLTDEKVDNLVDSVRLNPEDRQYLKEILKQRRDFIVNKFTV